MKYIALALHAGEPGQRNLVTNHFASRQWAYWHWIDDFWIAEVPDAYTPRTLWSEIEALPGFGMPSTMLFEMTLPISYWGRGDKAAWDWLAHVGNAK